MAPSSEQKRINNTEEEELENKRQKTGEQRTLEASSSAFTNNNASNSTTDLIHQLQSQQLELQTAHQERDEYKNKLEGANRELEEMRSVCNRQKEMITFLQHWRLGTHSYTNIVNSTYLSLPESRIGDSEASQIAYAMRNPKCSVRRLNLSHNSSITARGMGKIALMLKKNNTLINLVLCDCDLGDSGAQELVAALPHNTTLRTLHLERNNMTNMGVEALATALKVCGSSLTTLNLSNNRIGTVGAKSVKGALLVNTTLTWLNLNGCDLGDSGAQEIAASLPHNTTLETLDLKRNNITNTGVEALATALKVRGSSLTTLNLSNNRIGTDGAVALLVNTSLTDLNLSSNALGDEGVQDLAVALQVNTTLTIYICLRPLLVTTESKNWMQLCESTRRWNIWSFQTMALPTLVQMCWRQACDLMLDWST